MHFPNLVKLSALTIAIAIFLSGCASSGALDGESNELTAAQHYKKAKRLLVKGEYSQAIQYYKKLESRFPSGIYTERAQIELIFSYFKNKQYETAIISADRFIKLHPNHQYVDYAYYLRGIASFDNLTSSVDTLVDQKPDKEDADSIRKTFNYFAQLIQRFPKSIYTPDAIKRMKELRENLARYETRVANYYQRHGAYLAAANRAKYVTENYPDSQVIPDALTIMTHSYRKLGMSQLASDSYRILESNYPEYIKTKKLNESHQTLPANPVPLVK